MWSANSRWPLFRAEYKKQVELAVASGASGVLGGRAFWKEYFLQKGQPAREQFAQQESADRVRQIDEMVQARAKLRFARYGLTLDELHSFRATENWHFRYGGSGASGGGPAKAGEGEVY